MSVDAAAGQPSGGPAADDTPTAEHTRPDEYRRDAPIDDRGAERWGPAGDRGDTRIADRVVEKIAIQALKEVEQASGAAKRWLGMRFGRDQDQQEPQVTPHRHGDLVTMEMTISVRYPAPVRQVTRRLREHVTTRVQETTGLQVRQVDIRIARLVRPDGAARGGGGGNR